MFSSQLIFATLYLYRRWQYNLNRKRNRKDIKEASRGQQQQKAEFKIKYNSDSVCETKKI